MTETRGAVKAIASLAASRNRRCTGARRHTASKGRSKMSKRQLENALHKAKRSKRCRRYAAGLMWGAARIIETPG